MSKWKFKDGNIVTDEESGEIICILKNKEKLEISTKKKIIFKSSYLCYIVNDSLMSKGEILHLSKDYIENYYDLYF